MRFQNILSNDHTIVLELLRKGNGSYTDNAKRSLLTSIQTHFHSAVEIGDGGRRKLEGGLWMAMEENSQISRASPEKSSQRRKG